MWQELLILRKCERHDTAESRWRIYRIEMTKDVRGRQFGDRRH